MDSKAWLELLFLSCAGLGGYGLAAKLDKEAHIFFKVLKITSVGAFGALLVVHMIPHVLFHLKSWQIPALALFSFFLAYLLHRTHHHHHRAHEDCEENEGHILAPLALSLHAFSDGLLLRYSIGFNPELEKTFLGAFLIHKILESFWLYGLMGRKNRPLILIFFILAFPAGFVTGEYNHEELFALALSAISLGFFSACYFFDFLLPMRADLVKSPKALGVFASTFLLMTAFLLLPSANIDGDHDHSPASQQKHDDPQFPEGSHEEAHKH